jgi:xylan 1,4-beta-xylosidase
MTASFGVAAVRNPVLPGCYPDPSVCRVGDDYFLVTSTFEYFPGLPVFHSRDLVSWSQLGHAIDRESQLDLSSVPSSGGLFAPTIRHHHGTFYIVNTLVHGNGRQGNFIVTAADPAGPWSDPIWLDDAPGIDPSLLFDDDRAWLCGTRLAEPGLWEGQTDVWLRELDLATMSLIGEEHLIWRGALTGAVWAEGPHIYRVGERYYLVAAEGGTERNHAVSVAVSEKVTGPYVGDPANPVLTHRNLGRAASVIGVGHADLVETPDGDWFAVLLATRTVDGTGSILGRETQLVPVEWQGEWPVFAPGVGRVEIELAHAAVTIHDDFDLPALPLGYTLVRTAGAPRYDLDTRPGWLRLSAIRAPLDRVDPQAVVARRMQHLAASARTLLEFDPQDASDEAGLVLRQSEAAHIAIAVSLDAAGKPIVSARRVLGGVHEALGSILAPSGALELGIHVTGSTCELRVAGRTIATTSCAELGSEIAGGFLGTWVGMFANAGVVADFDWFEYGSAAAS